MTAKAHQAQGELKGLAVTLPNQYILLATLSLKEAKEVHCYAKALEVGYEISESTNSASCLYSASNG
ncbi:MAG: Fic/DOC family N-terminal domain-containing protein [Glaciecola sp.]|nr:Fic/DOC family N-terminal domain-containing protein [Glaciecola sp.]